ncbi:asparagine synthase (glutamine-hydrolyzing) [Caminibacter pacificus]|uniref:asparagine synthase (glutamine-hydrolyzing) n=1 Tax=Caminibacter pacificus TaxID=1424653 RepID=A0AAJ4UYQ4_9BACT|nr:asparagine synthase (glutamine-hydrolyzing) [Caminibacter pacificus]QCI28081.1 asparagine synthase (glutamine-hydrolyzing) [Caminibacter pacificus]ROR41211.1 asparagine synthase (glutamine-hydrolysing) [Caminibacter pacificus]
MCAIFGIIGKYELSEVKKSLDLMLHRGKKYQKILEFKEGVFGFNRLAIENIDKNLQPLKTGDKVFVFNGEIYNYKNLIKKYDLNVNSEIEVIAKLWEIRGVDFIKELEGMFAIAVFDKKLYLFRDEFGKKPLYFTKNGIFASEIKAILPFVSKELDFEALSEYLAFNSSIAPKTIYKGIFKLPAGCYYDGEIKRWFDFERVENKSITKENVSAEVERLLIGSIEKRFMGDVEIGSLLSGGVDSSLIVALASKYRKIDTFSVGYEGFENYDERKYAKKVADYLGIKNFDVTLRKKDFFDNFENVLFHMDEPIADSSFFAAFHLAKSIPLKVVFSGEGSDELFLGYRRYEEFLGFFNAFLPNKKWLKKYLERYPEDIKEWEVFRRFFADEVVFRGINETFFQRQINKALRKNAFEVDYERFYKNWGSFYFTYFDMKVWLGEVLLMKLDKMFMSNTIEARSPFLDRDLVNFVFTLPEDVRGSKKWIVKEISQKYLPKEIVYRRKKGFAVPFYEWLKEEKELKRIIDINRKNKIFNEEYLKEIIKTGHKRYKQHIWSLYLFSRWYEKEFL